MKCKHCSEELTYSGDLSAPGKGQAWTCPNGHMLIKLGSTFVDPAEYGRDDEPPWVMTIEDVR